MKASHISYSLLGSFLLAVFVLQWWQSTTYPAVLWITLGSVGALGTVGIFFQRTRITSVLLIASSIGLTAAFLTVARTTHVPTSSTVDAYVGQTVTLTGIVSEPPDDRPTSMRYTVAAQTVTINGKTIPVTGRTLVTDLRMWPRYSYGDEVRVTGPLEHPASGDGFDYGAYLSRYRIFSTLRARSIAFVGAGHGNPLVSTLASVKTRFETRINELYPEPEASFLAGLLTGSRRGMPDHITVAFKQTGLTHIVAISGFNITIVITLIGSLLFFLPLKWRLIPTITAIVLFTLLVGASASVVRAAIMGILGLIALQTGRMPHARLLILWAASAMLLWNPAMLWDDAGFQLSFLAVIGLTECAPLLERLLKNVPNTFSLRDALMMTIAAQAFAMPWVVFVFGMLSVVSPVANILIEPLIPLAMLFGFLGTVISMIAFPLGQLVAFPAWGLLHFIIAIAERLSMIPGASLQIPSLSLPLLAAYYTVLIIALLEYSRRKQRMQMRLA
ncbi:MAG TPA: ComEC/Rec2 family competence protein [Candidatus Peribacteraceae bacterium]|nr:ComEC/Rec2 family competence protein [Candidatus Peribacteraceae bacterium]